MKKNYYSFASVFLLLLSLIAFSDNLITNVSQKSNSDPKFIIHGLFMFAWFIIFVVQTNFIRKGDIQTHKKWGVAGMITAIGVIISTVYVFFEVFKGWDVMPFFAKANRFFMFSFVVLVLLAYLKRKNGAQHKRYIYMASLLILEPILSRVSGNLHIENVDLFVAIVWNGLFISLFAYDWVTIKRIHPISWIGVVWFYIVWGISIMM